MKYLIVLLTSFIIVSCASTPTGEWKYLPVDGFFKPDITESELSLLLRQSELQCENDLIKLKSQSTNQTTQSSGNSSIDSFARGASMVQRMNAADEIRKFYPNCMELNGFKKVWVSFNTNTI